MVSKFKFYWQCLWESFILSHFKEIMMSLEIPHTSSKISYKTLDITRKVFEVSGTLNTVCIRHWRHHLGILMSGVLAGA